MNLNNLISSLLKNFKSIKNKYLYLLAISFFLFFTFRILFINLNSTQNKEPARTTPAQAKPTITAPTGSFSATVYQERTAKDSGPVYFEESSDLATDSEKEILGDGAVKYTFASENSNRSDIIIIKNGNILFTRHAVIGTEISNGYKNLLGKQDRIIPGPTFYGPETSIYFYSNGGTALIVNPKTNTTYEEFSFRPPISMAEFNSKYQMYTQ